MPFLTLLRNQPCGGPPSGRGPSVLSACSFSSCWYLILTGHPTVWQLFQMMAGLAWASAGETGLGLCPSPGPHHLHSVFGSKD